MTVTMIMVQKSSRHILLFQTNLSRAASFTMLCRNTLLLSPYCQQQLCDVKTPSISFAADHKSCVLWQLLGLGNSTWFAGGERCHMPSHLCNGRLHLHMPTSCEAKHLPVPMTQEEQEASPVCLACLMCGQSRRSAALMQVSASHRLNRATPCSPWQAFAMAAPPA